MTHCVLRAAQVGLVIATVAALSACLGGGSGQSADERRLQGTWTVTKLIATTQTCYDDHCEVTATTEVTGDFDMSMSFAGGVSVWRCSPACYDVLVSIEFEYDIDAANSTVTLTATDAGLTSEHAANKAYFLENSTPATYVYSFPASNRLRLEDPLGGAIEAKRSK